METISTAGFKATCLALLDRVEQTGRPILVARRGRPIAQISPVGKRRIMGCMEGTAKIVGNIESPTIEAQDWEVIGS
jgi:prevent-host-death family protein